MIMYMFLLYVIVSIGVTVYVKRIEHSILLGYRALEEPLLYHYSYSYYFIIIIIETFVSSLSLPRYGCISVAGGFAYPVDP